MVSPQPPRTVSGRVSDLDGNAFGDSRYTLQAFDRIDTNNIVPLSNAVALQRDGTYQITYTWTSTGGRNGPNLLVQLLDPAGNVAAQALKPFADRQEVLDLEADLAEPEPEPQPQPFTLSGVVRDRFDQTPLANVSIDAEVQVANGQTLATAATLANSAGEYALTFDSSTWGNISDRIDVEFELHQDDQALTKASVLRGLQPTDQTFDITAIVPRSYTLSGTVTDESSGEPVPNMSLELSLVAGRTRVAILQALSNQAGNYAVSFSNVLFDRLEQGAQMRVSVRLFQNQQRISTPSVLNGLQLQDTEFDIVAQLPVEPEEPEQPEDPEQPEEPEASEFIVRGTITQAKGFPLSGVIVRAFDRDLRHEQLLGEQTTDDTGSYEITYTRAQFRRAEKASADLVIKLFTEPEEPITAVTLATDTGDRLDILAYRDSQDNIIEIPIWFNAPPIATINGTLIDIQRQNLSLYEKIQLDISPVIEEISPTELWDSDIAFLAPETALQPALLARFILAHKLAQQAVQPQFWFALLNESIYEYRQDRSLEEQQEAVLAILPSLNATAVGNALTRSLNLQEISTDFQDNILDWIEAFLQFAAQQTVSDSGQPTFVKLALDDANIRNLDKQATFARLFNQYRAMTPELLDILEQDDAFTATEIGDLRTSFQLSNLTQGDFSVVKTIKQTFNVRQPEQIRILAKRSEGDWINFVTTQYAAGEIQLPIEANAIAGETEIPNAEIYGKTLNRQFHEAFPTTAFTGGLERALQNGGVQGLRRAEDIGRFLNHYENFELLNTPVDKFLQERRDPEFQELAADEDFRLEVKAVQRVFKLAPSFEAIETLLVDNLHSAQKVYR